MVATSLTAGTTLSVLCAILGADMFRKAQIKVSHPTATAFYTEPCPAAGICVDGILDWTSVLVGKELVPYVNMAFSIFAISAGVSQLLLIYVWRRQRRYISEATSLRA